MAAGIMEIEDSNFDAEVVQSDKPAVVDFWAPGAAPARPLAPFWTNWPKPMVIK
jgi:thioredoxin 1